MEIGEVMLSDATVTEGPHAAQPLDSGDRESYRDQYGSENRELNREQNRESSRGQNRGMNRGMNMPTERTTDFRDQPSM